MKVTAGLVLGLILLSAGAVFMVHTTYTVFYTLGGFEGWWNFHYMGTNGVVLAYIPPIVVTIFGTFFLVSEILSNKR